MNTTIQTISVLVLATLSFGVAMLITPGVIWFLDRFKLGKQIRTSDVAPIMSKMHASKSGTPTMGGILIWGTVLIMAFVFSMMANLLRVEPWLSLNFLTRAETLLPLGALFASAIIGLVDDYLNVRKIGPHGGGLRMRYRLLSYLGIALVGAWWFYVKLGWDILTVPFVGPIEVGIWIVPIFTFIIVATSFSVNETDGLDGLAGGTLAMAFASFGAIAFFQGKFDLAAFCAVIVGALLAFLWFNIYPAKFFMGDTGSMSLGVTLGIVAMLTGGELLLPIIGFVFVMESASVIIQVTSKKLFGKKVFLVAPIHHHFEAKGWPEPKVVMRFWIIGSIAAVLGLVIAILDKTFI